MPKIKVYLSKLPRELVEKVYFKIKAKEAMIRDVSTTKKPEDYRLYLTAADIAEITGLTRSEALSLMRREGFPKTRKGVARDQFFSWLQAYLQ